VSLSQNIALLAGTNSAGSVQATVPGIVLHSFAMALQRRKRWDSRAGFGFAVDNGGGIRAAVATPCL